MEEEDGEPINLCVDGVAEPDEESTNQEPLSQGENKESISTCMICMEEWTVGTAHRICCLKCGHLFGRSCIERWIAEKDKQAKCPTCNKPTRKVDIRNLWCKTITAHDSTEIAEIQKQLELERRECLSERALNLQMKNVNNQLYTDIERLKRDVIDRDLRIRRLEDLLRTATRQATFDELHQAQGDRVVEYHQPQPQPKELKGTFYPVKYVESNRDGCCRAITVCPTSAEILIAQPRPHDSPRLGNDFGIKKYSILDTNAHSFIYLHSGPLTSIQIKPFGDLILTSASDRKVHLTSINNSRKVQTYDCRNEPVCVSWSVHRDYQFYVTSRNCYISLYDMRNTSDCIYQKSERIARTTMISMTSIYQPGGMAGVVANDAKGSQFMDLSQSSDYETETIDHEIEHLKSYPLPFNGLMGTVDYHQPTNTTLITTRHSPNNPNSTHSLIKLKRVTTDFGERVDCENIRTFQGGPSSDKLSQSRILRHPTLDDQVLVGSWDQGGVKIWDASDNTVYQRLATNSFVRDIVSYTPENTNHHMLFALHEKGFGSYKWDYI